MTTPKVMDVNEIMQVLPHRYPMLLVDRITEIEVGNRVVGIKCVTVNEAFFQGHFPGMPIMPGVLIVEAMAQVGAVVLLSDPRYRNKIPVIGGIDGVKFRRPVVPGDVLEMHVELLWFRGMVGRIKASGLVAGETAAEMELTFKLIERD